MCQNTDTQQTSEIQKTGNEGMTRDKRFLELTHMFLRKDSQN